MMIDVTTRFAQNHLPINKVRLVITITTNCVNDQDPDIINPYPFIITMNTSQNMQEFQSELQQRARDI